jgi:hypothetical protein
MKTKFSIVLLVAALALSVAAVGQQPQAASGYAPSAALDTKGRIGLTLALGPSSVFCGGSLVSYGGGTLGMAASATNYVYLNTAASCAPATKTTAFTTSDIPLAIVTTSASAITSIQDIRTPFSGMNASGQVSAAGHATLTPFSTTQSGNLVATPTANKAYRAGYYLWQAASGTGGTCATSATVTLAFTWKDPSGTAQTRTETALALPPTLAAGAYQTDAFEIVTASGTAIAYSATYANGNCTTQPTAQAQIWIEAAN